MQQRVEKSFAGWGESGHTNPPRAALDLGYSTRKRDRLFHVREEFANERKDHRLFSLPAKSKATGTEQSRSLPGNLINPASLSRG